MAVVNLLNDQDMRVEGANLMKAMSSESQDLLKVFSRHIVTSRWDSLPTKARDFARLSVVDTLAVMLSGSTAEGVSAGVDLVTEWGGAAQATIAGRSTRIPSPNAAWMNGTMAQSRDFDAVHERGVFHVNSPIIAAAFAVAEGESKVSGKELLTSVAIAQDIAVRLAKSFEGQLRWSRTATVGTLAAAAAVSRVLHLSEDETAGALAIATCRAAGSLQSVVDGSLIKRYLAGFAAQSGVVSAMLSARGVTGPYRGLDGGYGFFQLYEQDLVDKAELTSELGEVFAGPESSIKPYPSAREHHGVLEAAMELVHNGIQATDIESIVVSLPPTAHAISGQPPATPLSSPSAIASAAYGVAAAFAFGGVHISNYQDSAFRDILLRELIPRVVIEVCTASMDNPLLPQSLTVVMKNGERHASTSTELLGSPKKRLSPAQFESKVDDCLAAAPSLGISSSKLLGLDEQLISTSDCAEVLTEFISGRK